MSRIPLVDLKLQHRQIAGEISEGFQRVFEGTSFILGPEVAEFERGFAAISGIRHCVGVANGTDALELVLRALEIGAGHEVILPVNTFMATALAVARTGAVPVLVDCDPVYQLIDVRQAGSRVNGRTRAIIPVHLFGQMAPMEQLLDLATSARVALVEDAAQAQGARRNGTSAGGFGIGAGTSFYPGKNLGAYGDAGAVLTNSNAIADSVRALRNYGSDAKYHHPRTGFNSRLDTLQAVVLLAKLRHLEEWNQARRAAAARYDTILGGLPGVTLPATLTGNEHVFHLYVIRIPRRDDVLRRLEGAGIGAGIHYPVPIHLQGAVRELGYKRGDFPVAEKAAQEILSLPLFPGITVEQQERVVQELKRVLS